MLVGCVVSVCLGEVYEQKLAPDLTLFYTACMAKKESRWNWKWWTDPTGIHPIYLSDSPSSGDAEKRGAWHAISHILTNPLFTFLPTGK